MALSPSIPTSFVPKQGAPSRRPSASNNVFLLISVVIFGLTLLSAGAVFLYSNYLKSSEEARGNQLIAEQKKVSVNEVEQFLRLKNRLVVSQTLMQQHVLLSQFLNELEKITLSNVRFSSLSLQVAPDRSATLTMVGQARTFNALAAQSKTFASEPYIKSAIFSNISPNPTDKTVAFSITAMLDPRIIVQAASPSVGVSPTNTTNTAPATTTSTTPNITLPVMAPRATSSAATTTHL